MLLDDTTLAAGCQERKSENQAIFGVFLIYSYQSLEIALSCLIFLVFTFLIPLF
jgi:hypothetical protein